MTPVGAAAAAAAVTAAAASVPTAAELVDPARAKIWRAAQDFEAMALGQFLQPMFATTESSGGAFDGGAGEATWRPMLTDEIARALARHGGLGLAAPVYRQMLRLQEGS